MQRQLPEHFQGLSHDQFGLEHAFRIRLAISKAELEGRERFDGRSAQV